ncbi:hypothetical protein M433DRAFT_132476 [Acidomyces richmondensis BFW]|nr:MAG: hypothetical protein FE78DRAFT_138826 [Acidomyces sp. 'richmondensis']KYG48048.1 hypothetical protein M433DRAFT_132476 [Acidomyces richmondensis BFW]
MADADEDVIPRSGPSAEDVDLSDEFQDFRFLSAISGENAKIPKRGEKDFESHGTTLQSDTLAASRQAMHKALSYLRVHQPKNHSIATYHPETNMAYAYSPKGPLFSKMGQVLSAEEDPLGDDKSRGQRLWLLPEEVLYLIDRGTLDVLWPSHNEDDGQQGLTMSLQGAYAVFLGDEFAHGGALTFERYSVYAGLKRAGYTVLRAPTWADATSPPGPKCFPTRRPWQVGLNNFTRFLWRRWICSQSQKCASKARIGPLVKPGLYRSYNDIYHRLEMIKWYDPTSPDNFQHGISPSTDPQFRITYHVWKPGSAYKKSNPGPPDFHIAVVNGRNTNIPTLEQLNGLLQTAPFEPPEANAQIYQKLKHGYKNVILAVVDQGVISYLKIADAAFGREKLYEIQGKSGGWKRGGKPVSHQKGR